MWVALREVNDYNQYGAYFAAAYINKPTRGQLKDLILSFQLGAIWEDHMETSIDHLSSGGGRIEWENEWLSLQEVKDGEIYPE